MGGSFSCDFLRLPGGLPPPGPPAASTARLPPPGTHPKSASGAFRSWGSGGSPPRAGAGSCRSSRRPSADTRFASAD
eukprot:10322300-Alexandrium_andersonii.AAC.1